MPGGLLLGIKLAGLILATDLETVEGLVSAKARPAPFGRIDYTAGNAAARVQSQRKRSMSRSPPL